MAGLDLGFSNSKVSLFVSSDGGYSWVDRTPKCDPPTYPRWVSMAMTGDGQGLGLVEGGEGGRMALSQDGGLNWEVSVFFIDKRMPNSIRRETLDPSRMNTLASPSPPNQKILWRSLSLSRDSEQNISSSKSLRILAVPISGSLLSSIDGGLSWKEAMGQQDGLGRGSLWGGVCMAAGSAWMGVEMARLQNSQPMRFESYSSHSPSSSISSTLTTPKYKQYSPPQSPSPLENYSNLASPAHRESRVFLTTDSGAGWTDRSPSSLSSQHSPSLWMGCALGGTGWENSLSPRKNESTGGPLAVVSDGKLLSLSRDRGRTWTRIL